MDEKGGKEKRNRRVRTSRNGDFLNVIPTIVDDARKRKTKASFLHDHFREMKSLDDGRTRMSVNRSTVCSTSSNAPLDNDDAWLICICEPQGHDIQMEHVALRRKASGAQDVWMLLYNLSFRSVESRSKTLQSREINQPAAGKSRNMWNECGIRHPTILYRACTHESRLHMPSVCTYIYTRI
jgi:hypothetical protein